MSESGSPWFEDDAFWMEFAPYMFNEDKWGSAPEEAAAALRLMEMEPGSRILDSCCGVGRHSVAFAELGCRVTGVDRTLPYLEAARETAASRELDIEFVHADVRTFRRERAFDGAANLFTSFGYFESPGEERSMVENIRDSLREGGAFLVDVTGKEVLARKWVERDWFRDRDATILTEYRIRDDWTRLENHWILILPDRRVDYTFSHRIYSAAELTALFLSSGFSRTEVYGGFDGRTYDQDAERLIVAAFR